MARQLIICCDGTNNNLTGRANDTNVTQLCELLTPGSNNQMLYYDPGVGNPGQLPGASWGDGISHTYERLHGLIFGKGIYENIEECYRFLMRNWQPGDEVFLFGFSRGAFTARSVGGLVTQFGILRQDMDVLVPTLLHLYFSNRTDSAAKEYARIRDQIRAMYTDDEARDAPIWFVGVWDTVASVGSPLFSRKITASPTIVDKRFMNVRQALALDEYRRNFLPRPYLIEKGYDYAGKGQSIEQKWFSGAHCDVGGGYANAQAGLSRQTLAWMLQEAADCRLRFRKEVLVPGTPNLDPTRVEPFLATVSALKTNRTKRAHAEAYDSPLWALGGQVVRDPADQGEFNRPTCAPEESPTVAGNGMVFPASTVWNKWRLLVTAHGNSRKSTLSMRNPLNYPLLKVLLAATAGFLFWILQGALLLGPARIAEDSVWKQLRSALGAIPQIADATMAYACWQLGWLRDIRDWVPPTTNMPTFVHPAGALFADFGFIVAYGYLLAFFVSWSFAQVAGLRRVGMARTFMVKALNVLGLAATYTVLGDMAENMFNLTLLLIPPHGYFPVIEFSLGLCITAASIIKWVGLAGCILLTVWGVAAKISPACRPGKLPSTPPAGA